MQRVARHVDEVDPDDPVLTVPDDRARLAVHQGPLYGRADSGEQRYGPGQHPGDVAGAGDAPGERRRLAPTVPDQLDVGREERRESVHVTVPQCIEELRSQPVAGSAVGHEAGPTERHVLAGSARELAARSLGAPDRGRDGGEVKGEHLAEHEDRALQRTEPFEQQQGRHGHRVGQLRRPRRVGVGVVEQRFGEPRSDVGLPADPGRLQHVESPPG